MLTAQLIGNLGHGAESKQISERHALTFSVAHKEIMDKIRMVGLKDITGAVLGPQEAF